MDSSAYINSICEPSETVLSLCCEDVTLLSRLGEGLQREGYKTFRFTDLESLISFSDSLETNITIIDLELAAFGKKGAIATLKRALKGAEVIALAQDLRGLSQVLDEGVFACLPRSIEAKDLAAVIRRAKKYSAIKQIAMRSNKANNLAGQSLLEIEKKAIEQTLAMCNGNKAAAARMLKISERSIYNKIKK